VAWGQARELDVIVTDHHLAGTSLPPALAVIDPLRDPVEYPYLGLSGAGVAYKLVQALAERLPGRLEPERLLDLVAIGTVADLAPLDGENRSLVARGLDLIRSAPRPGLQELLRVAGVTPAALTATGIAFSLAPRLNAAGRMDSPRPAFELLIAEQASEAAPLAAGLDQANRERQDVTRREFERARDRVLALGRVPPLLAVLSAEMGEGILGLVAARLTEEFYRPSLVARIGPEVARASLRSIPEFPITAALEQIAERLLEFGGHTTAAGFSARAVELDEIVAALERMAGPVMAEDPSRQIRVDAVARLDELDADLLGFLDQLEPTGQGNPPVMFAAMGVDVLSKRAVGTDGAHLKLLLREGSHAFDAIAFRQGHRLSGLPRRVDVLFELERNRYLGVETLQMNVKDLRPASPQIGT
jgi:single-stranded-DNA-specific exonuclease